MAKTAARFEPAGKARSATRGIEQLPALWISAITVMMVVTHLVPFDTAAMQWNNVVVVMLWLLLLLGWALTNVIGGQGLRLDRTTLLVLAVTLLPVLSACALTVTASGNARLALNLGWQWAAFGITFLLVRQWLRNLADVRMLAAVMLAIVMGLGSLAVVQFVYLQPHSRAVFAQDPEGVLRELGLEVPPGSPMRQHFEDRLASTEPTATFSLTNSLAGLITPWLVLVVAIAGAVGSDYLVARTRSPPTTHWRTVVLLSFAALLLTTVLVLTKSRTAILATVGGATLALLYVTPFGRRIDWRILLALFLIVAVALLGGLLSGALDTEVFSEAPKSLLYRLQYWQATADMIRHYPLLGVGPGNFQDTYQHYQLPEASENIADPHNFALEIWAIAGTPAALVLLALMVVFAWELRRHARVAAAMEPSLEETLTAPWRAHLFALVIGVLLAFVCGFLSDLTPDIALLYTGLPVAALALWLSRDWVERGQLTLPMLVLPLVALLVNLLAAGGIGFPGVSTSIWILMAMALVTSSAGQRDAIAANGSPFQPPLDRRARSGTIAALVVIAAAIVAYHLTVYSPVFRGRAAQSDAQLSARRGRLALAIEQANAAAQVDPLSHEIWLNLAAFWHARMRAEGDSPALRVEFDRACDEAIVRDPRSYSTRAAVADWRFMHYRLFGNPNDLAAAGDLYAEAAERFPNHAKAHAQLAWVLHLKGDASQAAEEAAMALNLDSRHDHQEYKLKKLAIFDPGPAEGLRQALPPQDLAAEPLMRRLRTASIHP